MDDLHFDALTRGLAFPGSRRRFLAELAAAPVIGGLLGILAADETEAGRRKRRVKRHKHGKGRRRPNRRGKRQKPQCTPESAAQTCAGQCGSVTNTCGQAVACGSCACDPPCGICQTCDPKTGSCIPDPAQRGDACGQPGQVCQPDGTCVCDATSCGACRSCHRSGECTNPCASAGCCDGETCQPGLDDDACGNGGAPCAICTGQDTCQENENNEYLCTCVPDCTGKPCGAADGCGGACQTGLCGQCQTCQAGVCVTAADGTACDTGNLCVQAASCQAGECAVQIEVSCLAPANVCRTAACNPATGRCVESPRPEGYPCDVEGLCLERHSTCNGGGFCIAVPVRCQDSRDNCCFSGVYPGQCRRLGGAPCTVGAQCCSNTCWSSGTCA